MKFTFKRNVPTGPYRSFFKKNTYIRLKGLIVGSIQEGDGFYDWYVRLSIKDETNENAGRRWIQLKKRFSNEAEARQFLNDNFEKILEKDLAGY